MEEKACERMMRESMASMHASDDLYERVMAQAEGGASRHRPMRRGRALPIAAVAGIVLAVMLAAGGTAYAAVRSGYLRLDWTDLGSGKRVDWSFESDDGAVLTHSKTYSELGPGRVGDDFDAMAQDVGLTAAARGYTLTVGRMAIDASGCGAVTMTLSNPDGVKIVPGYGVPGEFALDDPAGAGVSMDIGDGEGQEVVNTFVTYDAASATETSVSLVVHFDAFGDADVWKRGVSWGISWNGENGTEFARTDAFHPEKVVGTKRYADGEAVAKLSPMSLNVKLPGSGDREVVVDDATFVMDDGSEVVVSGDATGELNFHTASLHDDGSTSYTLSKFVDAGRVRAVRIEARKDMPDGSLADVTYELPAEG